MPDPRFKKWRQSEKGRISLKNRTERYLSTEKGILTGRRWMENNREKINKSQLIRKKKDLVGYMLNNARHRAKQKGLDFLIDREDIIMPIQCPVLGMNLEIGEYKRMPQSPSLDRKDSSKGYIPGNVQVISFRANMLKNNATLEEIEKLYFFMKLNQN